MPSPVEPINYSVYMRESHRRRLDRLQEGQSFELPTVRRSSEFSSVQIEAQNRLYQVYDGDVGGEVSRLLGEEKFLHISSAARDASRAIHESTADGPIDLALNESNVRGMLTWALDEAGLEREDRQQLIKIMEDMGVGRSATVGRVSGIRSGEGQFEEGRGHSTTRREGATLNGGYEPRERSRNQR